MTTNKYPTIKIIVACHKADPNIRQDDIYMPIQVGKDLHPDIDLGFQCDNTGDNISYKNASYCELTALYWAWKNLKNVDYIGLCHYRRYFEFNSNWKSIKSYLSKNKINTAPESFIPEIIGSDEIVLPTFFSKPTSIWTNFEHQVLAQDLYITYKIIQQDFPEYLESFEKYLLGNWRTGYNMFIMSYNNFDAYCSWLFSLLDKVESSVKLSPYSSYQRLFGYLGEILLPVYVQKNKLKIKEKPIVFTGHSSYESNIRITTKKKIRNILNSMAFFLSNLPIKKSLYDPYWETYLKNDGIEI